MIATYDLCSFVSEAVKNSAYGRDFAQGCLLLCNARETPAELYLLPPSGHPKYVPGQNCFRH